MKRIRSLLIINIYCISFIVSPGQDSAGSNVSIIEPVLSYTCDIARNFSGGIKTGNSYMGLINAGILIHTHRLWKGGDFFVEFMNTHGYNLSENCIGDLQVVSNIENGDYTFIYQLLFTQQFGNGHITLGLQDLNAEFVTSTYGGALTNSSFGIHSTFPLNMPVSIYPKNGLAALVCFEISDLLRFRTGIFDGDAGSLEDDRHNLDWSIQDLLSINELEIQTGHTLRTTIKIGGYYHSGSFYDFADTTNLSDGNYGFYLVTDQQLTNTKIRETGVFGQFGMAPKDRNFNTWYAGFGVNIIAPFEKRPDDIAAFGISCAGIYDNHTECDIEFNYSFCITKYIALQPVLHYVINPGANQGLDNAVAGLLRVRAGL